MAKSQWGESNLSFSAASFRSVASARRGRCRAWAREKSTMKYNGNETREKDSLETEPGYAIAGNQLAMNDPLEYEARVWTNKRKKKKKNAKLYKKIAERTKGPPEKRLPSTSRLYSFSVVFIL